MAPGSRLRGVALSAYTNVAADAGATAPALGGIGGVAAWPRAAMAPTLSVLRTLDNGGWEAVRRPGRVTGERQLYGNHACLPEQAWHPASAQRRGWWVAMYLQMR